MKITFYGTLGSIPGGNSDLSKNSTCILIENGVDEIIIDAGSSINSLLENSKNATYHLFFTHYHLDHIIGLPFTSALFDSNKTMHFYGGILDGFKVDDVLRNLLQKPMLPMDYEKIKCRLHYHTMPLNQKIMVNTFLVEAKKGTHPGEVLVYKITSFGKTLAIVTDVDPTTLLKKEIIDFCRNVDCIYIDGNLLDIEVINNIQFGHPSIEQGIEFYKKTKAKRLLIGHHKGDRMYHQVIKYETNDIKIAKENSVFNI